MLAEDRSMTAQTTPAPFREARPITAFSAVHALDIAGHGVLCALPAVMVVANRSAALTVALAALLVAAGRMRPLGSLDWRAGLAAVPRGWRAAALAALAWALVSTTWSVSPALSLRAVTGAGVPLLACALLAAAWRAAPRPRWFASALAAGLILGALLVVAELRLGYPVRRHISDRLISFVENRPTLTLTMLLWPTAALLARRGMGWTVLALAAAVVAASAVSTSGASKFCLAVGSITALASWFAPRWSLRVATVTLLLLVAVQPVFGDLAARMLPQRLVEASAEAHPSERIAIWQSYGEVARLRLLTGIGFGSAPAAGRDPVAGEVDREDRTMLDVGHPHDAPLQVWVELGLPGALALGGAILAVALGLRRLEGAARHAGLAALMAASAVCLVDHEAWQGWWAGVMGFGFALFTVMPADRAARRSSAA